MTDTRSKQSSGWPRKFESWLVGNLNEETGEWRGYCPLHEDPDTSSTPSASFNFNSGVFNCVPKCGGMTLATLWGRIKDMKEAMTSNPAEGRTARVRSIADAPSKRTGRPLPSESQLDEMTEALLDNEARMEYLRTAWHYDEEMVRKFQLGFFKARYTIPIFDHEGVLINVRRYDPDAGDAKQKMVSWANGTGTAVLYGWEALQEKVVVFTEGEKDRLVGCGKGLNAMTHTGGASVWKPEWSPHFEGKEVFFCYDLDDSGRAGMAKAANSVSRYASGVYLVRLPLSVKGADLTDYLVGQGYSLKDFEALMESAREKPYGTPKKPLPSTLPAERTTLEGSMSGHLANKPIELYATVAGKVQPAYLVPKTVHASCGQDWVQAKCAACIMTSCGGIRKSPVASDDTQILRMINANEEKRSRAVKEHIGIPPGCPRVDIVEEEQYAVEELVLVPSVETRSEDPETPIQRRALNVGDHKTPVNIGVHLTGVNSHDPYNGRSVLQSWKCEPMRADLDQFEVSERIVDRLAIFRPDPGQTVLGKMEEIAEDISVNITHIYGRPELHMAYDAVWHSVMDFKFLGKPLGKGWLEMIVVGDTRTGKSEAANRIIDHYQSGILKSCEGSTFAGLVGGAAQTPGGASWMVTWGAIPLNDRRLVVLDEFSGLVGSEKNAIEQMSSIRSSGKAQITKIASAETSARTRLIWISNPVDGRAMNEISGGATEALKQLVKNPEDIARFDLAMSAASGDVSSDVINASDHDEVQHVYTTELCSLLVRWCWSRKADDILFAAGVEDYILERAQAMGGRYVSDPPLVQSANVRIKLARLSVSLAARTFSTDKAGEKVFVHKEHVQAAEAFLDILYGMDSFGYKEHSRKVIKAREKAQEQRKACYTYLLGHQDDVYPALQAVMGNPFRVRDFEEFGNMYRDDAQMHVRELMGMRMLRRKDKGYLAMEPALIEVMRALEAKLEKETP